MKDLPFVCVLAGCGKRFKTRSNVENHFQSQDHENDPRIPEKGSQAYRRLIGECKNGAECIITKSDAKGQFKIDKRKFMGLKQVDLWSNKLEDVTDEHEETENENEEFHCQPCGKTYYSKDDMDHHKLSQEHLKKLNATFDSLNDDQNPNETMVNGKMPSSSQNETSMTSMGKRRAKDNRRFQCPYCDSKLRQKHNLKKHIEVKHEKEFSSTDLSKILPIENDIDKPNNTAEEKQLETSMKSQGKRQSIVLRFQCPYCDSKIGNKNNLKRHIEANHEEKFSTTDFSQILPIENDIEKPDNNAEKKQ